MPAKHQSRQDSQDTRQDGQDVRLAEIAVTLGYIQSDVSEVKSTIRKNLVTQDQLNTVKGKVALLEKAVYGFIGIAISVLLVAVFTGVLRR